MAKNSIKNIVSVIFQMTKGKEGRDLDSVLAKVMSYLVKKRLLGRTPEILKRLNDLINNEEGTVPVKLTFKKIPTQNILVEIEESLKKRYRAKNISAAICEDENVLGGVKVEACDEIMDLTVRHKINQLRNYLITN